ncbi:hypothetical protein GF312_13090 [Candidatus Poribacteria bacterium]|nr:hypothetical protein [Candidatus Poribacteria bacterium]
MRSMLIISILLSLYFATCPSASSEQVDINKDKINWEEQFIYAKGMGLPPGNARGEAQKKVFARLAAKVDAQRRLLEVTKGIRIDAETQMVNMMVTDSKVKAEVTGYLGKFAEIVEDSEIWNGEYYELQMRIPMKGFYKIIYKKKKDQFLPPKSYQKRTPLESSCTGIVIDCRKLKLSACVYFQVIGKNGEHAYGVKNALYRFATDTGLAGYNNSLKKTMKDKRVGKNPRLIKAVDVLDKINIVISSEDVDFFHHVAYKTNILAECRIIVVVD